VKALWVVNQADFEAACWGGFRALPTTGRFLTIFFALIGVLGAQKTVRFAALKTLTAVFSIDP
jgi:hypothetical protein